MMSGGVQWRDDAKNDASQSGDSQWQLQVKGGVFYNDEWWGIVGG